MMQYNDWDAEDAAGERQPWPFHFSGFAQILSGRSRSILWSTGALLVVSSVVALFVKSTYDSTAVILPPKQEQSIGTLLSGQPVNLSSLGGSVSALSMGLKNPNEVYLSLLKSRTLTTQLVRDFNLQSYYRKRTIEGTLKALMKHTQTELGKDNLIRITVTSYDPVLSSQLANAFVGRLHTMNTDLALTDAAQRRSFYQQQLDQEKGLLAQAEASLQETQQKTGVLQPTGQAEMVSRNISTVRAQIVQREASLESMRTYLSDQNPDYLQMRAQLNSLRAELQELENSTKSLSPGDIEVPTAQLPKSTLEYARKLRDVHLHEQVYALLVKQYEAAKIDEAKSAPQIEIVDVAVPAERPTGPYRWLIALSGLAVGLFFNLALVAYLYVAEVLRQPILPMPEDGRKAAHQTSS